MWYWYVAKPNEIFLDLDSGRAITRALSVLRRALNVKPSAKAPICKLPIKSVWMYQSVSGGNHVHLIVVTDPAIHQNFHRKVAWSLWMGADQLRAAYVMQRFEWMFDPDCDASPLGYELLATHRPYGFRKPDAVCRCKEKHKPKHVTDKCPVLIQLLGNARSHDYFPRNRDRVRRAPVRFAWGQVPLSNLKRWVSNA